MKTERKQISPLAAFCDRHKISQGKLSKIASLEPGVPASKPTIHRLLHEDLEADLTAQIREALAKHLPDFLFQLGLSAAEIDKELLQIFDKGEYTAMSKEKTILPNDVQKYFGLNGDPFSRPPRNRQEVFVSPVLKDVVERIVDAIKFQGFIMVTGDIGSGKTTVRKMVEETLSLDASLKFIFPETEMMERVTPGNISRAILQEFNIDHVPNDSVWRSKKVKKALASAFKDDGVKTALGFDEAHRLNSETMSALKNFSEMNSGGFQHYLGIVLFGQPSLTSRLKSGDKKRDFREIYERITEIKMPDFKESAAPYLAHRLALVGGKIEDLFDQDALDFLCQHAKTPLQFGNIVNTALILAKNHFKNQKVIGSAIRTKMKFAETHDPKVLSMGNRTK